MLRPWSGDDLVEALVVPGSLDPLPPLVVLVAPPVSAGADDVAAAVARLATLPVVVVAHGWAPTVGGPLARPGDRAGSADVVGPSDPAALVDLVADDADLEAVLATVERCPIAATALALHSRGPQPQHTAAGLVAESALYSALQAGPEFAAWRAATPRRDRGDGDVPRVRVERVAGELRITLTRPAVRNALDAALRDQVLDALAVAEADPALRVVLAGEGPSFCAGGDLDEFGTAADPATAHLLRLRLSLGAALDRLSARTTVHVHGRCAGSGVELAAFAGTVVADPATTFVLPEVAMGLVPGAGGTVSVRRRIGRHRLAWMALTGHAVDATTAQRWGLVDQVSPR